MNIMFCPDRRSPHACASLRFCSRLLVCLTIVSMSGCMSRLYNVDGNGSELTETRRELASPDSLQLVGDLAQPWGIKWLEVEGVSLTVGLDATGSDPAPSADYKMLVSEMRVRQVEGPEAVLASPSTALTMVRALIPPGAEKGDRVDVEVRVPTKSETSSLHGGWLMLSRLKEFARINGRLSSGHVLAMAQGSILVDATMEGTDDPVLKTRGVILGGGVITKSRELGLRIRGEHLSPRTSRHVGEMINRRFHIYDHGDKKGVANPKKDSFISLVVHPRYRDNLMRYIRVIENIPVRESASALVGRLEVLQTRLADPVTAAEAAVQLEAIGKEGVPVLLTALRYPNPELRFYAAEALAYLNEPAAAATLAESIRTEPAFRWRAFRALGAMDDLASQEELALLMSHESAETRYGAFRSLHKLAPDDPLVRGEVVGEEFQLHVVDVESRSMVHVSKSDRPEIVVFGQNVSLRAPLTAFAGKRIVVKNTEDGRIRVRRLSENDDDRQLIVSSQVADVVRAIVEMDGSYSDVVQVLTEARARGSLACRLDFGAVPQPGRKFRRGEPAKVVAEKQKFVPMPLPKNLQQGAAVPVADRGRAALMAHRERSVGRGEVVLTKPPTLDRAVAPVVDAQDGLEGVLFKFGDESEVPTARSGPAPSIKIDFADEVDSAIEVDQARTPTASSAVAGEGAGLLFFDDDVR